MKTARKFPRAAVTFRVEIDGEGFTMNGTPDLAIGDGGHGRFPGNGDVRRCVGALAAGTVLTARSTDGRTIGRLALSGSNRAFEAMMACRDGLSCWCARVDAACPGAERWRTRGDDG